LPDSSPAPASAKDATVAENVALAFPAPSPDETQEPAPSFPIVGIGASAGGLAALEGFFSNLPTETESGIAFVIVQHLDPGHKSILVDLVQRYTKMQVYEVEDGMTVEPNCTYIIPPNKDMALMRDKLHLLEPAAPRGLRLPIDFFFRSLAQDRGEQAICVVLSGAGTDGTLGLRAIKEVGGMAMAQSPDSAGYDGMPRSAVATGLADYILPPKEMPKQLIGYVQHIFGRKRKGMGMVSPDANSWIQRVLVLLRSSSGHDFSCYKQSTILRRVERRMAVHQIERIDQYVQYLRQNENEQLTLFRELLIGVTGFFRDPEAYQVLLEGAINHLLENRPVGSQLRVWVPGCSTGEEAYSIAVLFMEQMERSGRQFNLQVFATDIDQVAIEKARVGLYPANIAADVTPERLGRFFVREGEEAFRVKKNIRDVIVFAEQDVIKDPPFSKIDLLSCRNLLIYMQGELQRKVIPVFHYALNPGGFLFLGSSESVGEFSNLFEPMDRKWKLYLRKEVAFPRGIGLEIPVQVPERAAAAAERGEAKEKKINVREVTERTLLTDYAPACVTVNARGEILYVYGRTGKYLELAPGEMSAHILRAAREGLRLELATALRKATTGKKTIRYDGLTVKTNGDTERVNLIVKPADVLSAESGTLLVIFEPVAPMRASARSRVKKTATVEEAGSQRDQHIVALERELRIKEEYLQSTVEELETANEELKSANEELQSTNEELQSTNEELETSKEELQSVNEELVTVNTELQQKIEDLSRANNDMNNLLTGTGIGTIFVDHQQNILRFTPAVTQIIPLIQTDLGRPLDHVASTLTSAGSLRADIQTVLDKLTPHETEVQTKDGRWYLMSILPYRTLENVIEGAVLTFVEITEQKRLQESLRASEEHFRVAIANSPIVVFNQDEKLRYTWVYNPHPGFDQRQFLGKTDADLLPAEDAANLTEIKRRVLVTGEIAREEVRTTINGQTFFYDLCAEPLRDANGNIVGVTCVTLEITERKRVQESLRESEEKYAALFKKSAVPAALTKMPEGVFADINESFQAKFGYTRQEVLGKTSVDIGMVRPEERAQAYRDLEQQGLIEGIEKHFHTKSGEVRDCLINVSKVEISGGDFVITTFYDIAEYKRGNAEILHRLAVVVRDANDAITVFDLQGRILAWNPAAEKMYGWSEADALAMNIREIVPNDKRAEYDVFVEKLARGEIIETFETQRVTKAGQVLDVRLTVTALVDAQGKPHAIATTERNVTR
jgi:two-component system CheB/CheR fusion protein